MIFLVRLTRIGKLELLKQIFGENFSFNTPEFKKSLRQIKDGGQYQRKSRIS